DVEEQPWIGLHLVGEFVALQRLLQIARSREFGRLIHDSKACRIGLAVRKRLRFGQDCTFGAGGKCRKSNSHEEPLLGSLWCRRWREPIVWPHGQSECNKEPSCEPSTTCKRGTIIHSSAKLRLDTNSHLPERLRSSRARESDRRQA